MPVVASQLSVDTTARHAVAPQGAGIPANHGFGLISRADRSDSTSMTQTCAEPVAVLDSLLPEVNESWCSEPARPADEVASVPETEIGGDASPRCDTAMPGFFCAACHHPIHDITTPLQRCPGCARRLTVPHHVSIRCDRCGRRHQVRVTELRTERHCAACSKPLVIADVALAPRHRHHHHHRPHSRLHGSLDRRSDAAWAVLIIGLTILMCVGSLIAL